MNKTYITTAIPYVNGSPHVGHAMDYCLADVCARYHRLVGDEVKFQVGTDEHGEKIEKKAKEAGLTPKEYVDKVVEEVKRIYDMLGTSYDRFIRTTDEDHIKACQNMFERMYP